MVLVNSKPGGVASGPIEFVEVLETPWSVSEVVRSPSEEPPGPSSAVVLLPGNVGCSVEVVNVSFPLSPVGPMGVLPPVAVEEFDSPGALLPSGVASVAVE